MKAHRLAVVALLPALSLAACGAERRVSYQQLREELGHHGERMMVCGGGSGHEMHCTISTRGGGSEQVTVTGVPGSLLTTTCPPHSHCIRG
jgi:hypothetical protein